MFKMAASILFAQLFIFFLAEGSRVDGIVYLSLLPIVCFAFIYGELAGLIFATATAMCFSPLWIDLSGTGSAWWVVRAFGFAFVAITVGGLSSSIKNRLGFEEKVRLMDLSTGLPNRQSLNEKLASMSAAQENGHFAIVVAIISNRNTLIETFGNDVIKTIFNQLKDRYIEFAKKINSEIEAYSLGSNQVAFLFKKSDGDFLETKENFENGLINITKRNFLHNGFFIHSDSHLGLYRFSNFSEINSGNLPLRYAEEAVGTALKQMKDLVIYGPATFTQSSKQSKAVDILGEIDLAIRSRWMFLVYQPKIDISTGKIHSVEALIRWNHPTKGFIPPALFIPQAEQSTLIENITDFVLKQAILQLNLWQRSGIFVNIAVNISTYNLLQPNFVNKVLNWLKEKELSPEYLEIEVTEGALISDFQHVLDGLNRFHDAKIKIALDDFGTGYSSFQYLQRLPIDYLKIDQSFVRNLEANRESKEIVKAIVDLAHTIDVKTIAEGVETKGDYEYLNSICCDIGQGFFMSKPLTSNAFVSWYSENNGVFRT
jgi:EAL domain-containing protein (putative c-di-GMP-specific phosphodiesterase class I)